MTMTSTTPALNSFTPQKSGAKTSFEDSLENTADQKDRVGWEDWEDGWFAAKPQVSMPDVNQTAVAQEINHPDLLNKPIATINFVNEEKTNYASTVSETPSVNNDTLIPFWIEGGEAVKEVGQTLVDVGQDTISGALDLGSMMLGLDSKPASEPKTEDEQKAQNEFNFIQNAIKEQAQAAKQVEFNQQEEIAKTISRISEGQVSYGDIAQEAGGNKVALVTAFEIASERSKKIEAANSDELGSISGGPASGPNIEMNQNNKDNANAVQYITG